MTDKMWFVEQDGKLFMTWKGVDFCLQTIKSKALPFKYVVGIERGGLILALIMSVLLGIPWGSYSPKKRKIRINGVRTFKDEDVLLIDDIEDSGETLRMFWRKYPKIINTAVMLKRRSCLNLARAEAAWVETGHWIVFPWEVGLGTVKEPGKDYEK